MTVIQQESPMKVFEEFESQVRSYSRSFPTIFKKSKGYKLWDIEDKEYIDSNEGRLVNALKDGKGTAGRYVRLYSKGNTSDEANHYVEVEVWGKPPAPK